MFLKFVLIMSSAIGLAVASYKCSMENITPSHTFIQHSTHHRLVPFDRAHPHPHWHHHSHESVQSRDLWYSPHDTYHRARFSSKEGESLIQVACRAPSILEWKRGRPVRNAAPMQLPAETAIATFAANGLYSGHAAIYKNQTREGVWVFDQYNGKPAGTRLIRWDGEGIYDDGDQFYILESDVQPPQTTPPLPSNI